MGHLSDLLVLIKVSLRAGIILPRGWAQWLKKIIKWFDFLHTSGCLLFLQSNLKIKVQGKVFISDLCGFLEERRTRIEEDRNVGWKSIWDCYVYNTNLHACIACGSIKKKLSFSWDITATKCTS